MMCPIMRALVILEPAKSDVRESTSGALALELGGKVELPVVLLPILLR